MYEEKGLHEAPEEAEDGGGRQELHQYWVPQHSQQAAIGGNSHYHRE